MIRLSRRLELMHYYRLGALAGVEALCAALFEQQVRITILSELAAEDDVAEVILLTSDCDIEFIEASNEDRATTEPR